MANAPNQCKNSRTKEKIFSTDTNLVPYESNKPQENTEPIKTLSLLAQRKNQIWYMQCC